MDGCLNSVAQVGKTWKYKKTHWLLAIVVVTRVVENGALLVQFPGGSSPDATSCYPGFHKWEKYMPEEHIQTGDRVQATKDPTSSSGLVKQESWAAVIEEGFGPPDGAKLTVWWVGERREQY